MNFSLIVILVILFINKIRILKKELKLKEQKLWPIYFSSLIAEVTSLLGVYIIQSELIGTTLSDFINFCLIYLICIMENVVLLIIGIVCFIKQKSIKKEKTNNHTLLKIFLTFICIWGINLLIAYIPKMFKTETEKYIEDYVEEYMTKKYGNGNFRVINIAKNYAGGFWEPEVHSGYYVKIKSSYTDEIIGMFINGTTKETLEVSYDSLINDYHKVDEKYDHITDFQDYIMSKKIKIVEDEYKKQFDVDIDFDCYYKIPDDYGHIPSINELVELCPVNTNYINITINDYVEKNNEFNYLKRLAKYSMNYFNDKEEVNIYYTLNYRKGFVKINYSTITIKLDDSEKIFTKEEIQNYTN